MIFMRQYCGEKSDQEVNGQLGDFKQRIKDQPIQLSFIYGNFSNFIFKILYFILYL